MVNTHHCTSLSEEFIKLSSAILAFSYDTTSLWGSQLHRSALFFFSLTLGHSHLSDLWLRAPAETHPSPSLCLSLSLFTEVTYLAPLRSSVLLWQMPELLSQLQPGSLVVFPLFHSGRTLGQGIVQSEATSPPVGGTKGRILNACLNLSIEEH